MLLSTVFHLKALERGSLPQYMGAAVRSEFLSWMGVTADNGDLNDMHDGNKPRPYTISDLKGTFRAQKGFNLVEAGSLNTYRFLLLILHHRINGKTNYIPCPASC